MFKITCNGTPLTVEMRVNYWGRGSVDEKSIERVSCGVTAPEVALEEMASRTVLKVTQERCLGELCEEAAAYSSQMYVTIKRCTGNHFTSLLELPEKRHLFI